MPNLIRIHKVEVTGKKEFKNTILRKNVFEDKTWELTMAYILYFI